MAGDVRVLADDARMAWSRRVSPLTVVRYQPQNARYDSLDGNCLANDTLPSLAFGYKGCSLKWKRTPQDKWCQHWTPATTAWAHGLKVRRV